MMKRTFVIDFIISVMMGFAAGSFMQLAIYMSSTYFGVLAIGLAIGCVLNILCVPNKQKKDED